MLHFTHHYVQFSSVQFSSVLPSYEASQGSVSFDAYLSPPTFAGYHPDWFRLHCPPLQSPWCGAKGWRCGTKGKVSGVVQNVGGVVRRERLAVSLFASVSACLRVLPSLPLPLPLARTFTRKGHTHARTRAPPQHTSMIVEGAY